jgi:phosphate transport system permease protein
MTDAAVARGRALDLTSDAARAHVRRRYRAEARFRAYGIAAIGFAALALVVLVADIVVKAIPAFTISELTLEVQANAEAIDPSGSNDPAVIARGDFLQPIRQALLADFPGVAENRRQRQALYGLLSSDASMGLRSAIMADPSLIGSTVTVPVLVSDDADLFYKGLVTRIEELPTRGIASPSGTTGTVTLLSSANDFSDELIRVKTALSAQAAVLRRERDRLRQLDQTNTADLIAARDALADARATGGDGIAALEGAVTKFESDEASLRTSIDGLSTRIADLENRFDTAGSPETLDTTSPSVLVEVNGGVIKVTEIGNDRVTGEVLIPLASTDNAQPDTWRTLVLDTPEANRKLSDQEIAWLQRLEEKGAVSENFNWQFFSSGDSREAELAGILGALVGSAYTMLVTLIICLPIGVASAIYLEEFAPKNRWTEIIEVNINNLAAVPSIVFGLLGLAVFLNFFGLPRSSPLVGGLVLALLVLPTIIIASRAALKAVPPSIREAALGVGASHQQAVFHHVLPLAMPGVLTGTIIGMAHALGETAPLLLIGMIAFIVDVPQGVTQAATVLPVQIFLWSDLPEVGFQAKTSAAIIVLLLFLFVMNGIAIVLRKRFERRW